MNKITGIVIAVALCVIAINMTFSTLAPTPSPEPRVEEKVVQVVGRTCAVSDGLGADVGFLVKDGSNLKVINYDRGSMADHSAFKPEYLRVTKFSNGQTIIDPIMVETFH